MLDYRAIHDSDPTADAAAFYEFVKKILHVEVTKVDKMKRLRKKYRNNAGRGKTQPFPNPTNERHMNCPRKFGAGAALPLMGFRGDA
nr:putative transcription factor [Quercus suber]